MAIRLDLAALVQLAPNARSSYRAAAAAGQPVLDRYGISANRLRIAHFLAQVLHESGALTLLVENLNYSAKRLPQVWPKRFAPLGPLDPADYANQPEKLANSVYGGRMGNVEPGDGFRYRGRGLLQLTGREAYHQSTQALRLLQPLAPDFERDPDAVAASEWCLQVAAAEWDRKGCNLLADQDSLHRVTRAINGGLNGLGDRHDWLMRVKALV
ncbi:MAG: glycoside hydrolase family 19 protein [Burkholderiales bacterium]|nr:glycoside hydrolase family 19 protein [Burkholderiales bacterium]